MEKDKRYQDALDLILKSGKVSMSYIQRHLKIGYTTAYEIIDRLQEEKIISPPDHVGRRQILVERNI